MINKVNGLIIGYPIDKSMLPKRDFLPSENKNIIPNNLNHSIIAGKETNKVELQEMAGLLSQEKLPFASFWGLED